MVSPCRWGVLGLAGAIVLLGQCTIMSHVGLVTQNTILWFGDTCSAHFPLRIVVLVNALVHAGTGGIQVGAVVVRVVDNSRFFSTFPQLLLRAPFITRCLDRG